MAATKAAGGKRKTATQRKSSSAKKSAEANGRQAVVIVHGMGEQRPLETLRGFVEAVWGSNPTPGDHPSDDDVWLVPDNRAGLTELARITTRHVNGMRTDFFELYWSDILVGNTFSQVRGWVRGLLWRWPHQVPRESLSMWVGLWLISAIVLGLTAYIGLTVPWSKIWEFVAGGQPLRNLLTATASVVLWGTITLFLYQRLRRDLERREAGERPLRGIWTSISPVAASASMTHSAAIILVVPLAIALAAYLYFPWTLFAAWKTYLFIVAAVVAFVLGAWVVPVFGDVARYVRTSPDAVASRARIRERGVELLRALHGPAPGDAALRYDHGDLSKYDRIAVVGHSLGSIVAYDVLRLFWEERGPTRINPTKSGALSALRAVDDFCRGAHDEPDALDTAVFRELQDKAASALAAAEDGNWRITDFVTLGSPLTHAEFLISRDRLAFDQRKAERMFPTCPPMLELGAQPSFLYNDRKYAHHAAMFATTRWTNIYDPGSFVLSGDFVSGPCRPNFGPGIVDIPVRIARGGLFGRLITHTDYWNMDATGQASDADGEKLGLKDLSKSAKGHVALLRAALGVRKQT
ncbi:MAG: hypothetical protein JJ969_00970 [Rhizobiaceae bacterium]|nr:hypothetical protein [Rhizobiaceae bacterium]